MALLFGNLEFSGAASGEKTLASAAGKSIDSKNDTVERVLTLNPSPGNPRNSALCSRNIYAKWIFKQKRLYFLNHIIFDLSLKVQKSYVK